MSDATWGDYQSHKSAFRATPSATIYGDGELDRTDHMKRAQAINGLAAGRHVVYALRMRDGAIKIGCTKNLPNRISGLHAELLGFRIGNFDDEKAIHASLTEHRNRGREYYHPTPEVFAVVNDLRDEYGLPHLAA